MHGLGGDKELQSLSSPLLVDTGRGFLGRVSMVIEKQDGSCQASLQVGKEKRK